MVQYPMQRTGVTAGFGLYNPYGTGALMHYAIDISRTQPESFDVYAAHDGEVVLSLYDAAGGNMVAVKGYYNERLDILTRYGHLASRAVRKGGAVKRGDVLGVQGNTGTATTGRHLHFETWLVPKGYAYSAGDRAKYAVDPLSVCQLAPGQQFKSDASTRGYEAIPYPEPKLPLKELTRAKLRMTGAPEMYFYPSLKYAPYAAGYDRRVRSAVDFLGKREFDAPYACENDGLTWAYIDTVRGFVWAPVRAGESELYIPDGAQSAPQGGEEQADASALAQRLAAHERAVGLIRDALAAL